MDLERLLIYSLLSLGVASFIIISVNLVGGSVYDFKQLLRQKELRRRRYRKKPLISIIIPIYNQQPSIEACLRSILASSYRKYEIIVVDNGSIDKPKKTITALAASCPKATIKLLQKRKPVPQQAAVVAGFKKYAKGDLVMVLQADTRLEQSALERTACHFQICDSKALVSNIRAVRRPTVLNLMQRFEYLSRHHANKFASLFGSGLHLTNAGIVLKRELLVAATAKLPAKRAAASARIIFYPRLYYASDVLVYSDTATSYASLLLQRNEWNSRPLSLQKALRDRMVAFVPSYSWGNLVLLAELFLVSYLVYLSVMTNSPLLLLVSWLTLCGLLAFIVWSDQHLRRTEKLQLSAYIPMMYLPFMLLVLMNTFSWVASLVPVQGRTKPR
jgi:cellulose synthase/poly-beta-1,6-N-acetylglucosamine synthase-like glycosyltransferase